ncbi:hypothetical protein WG906_04745 [Pedobacter sp. P351]|uniref:hypothetical protein n=1 Tax=Pedobacter superstes TaxID=3133441 RepID=UPI003094ECD7
MNWTHFLLNLTAIYLLYYALNILFDFAKNRSPGSPKEDSDTLFFAEKVEPELVALDDGEDSFETVSFKMTPVSPPTIEALPTFNFQSSGGEKLKDIFALAKLNIIEHTRMIPYG